MKGFLTCFRLHGSTYDIKCKNFRQVSYFYQKKHWDKFMKTTQRSSSTKRMFYIKYPNIFLKVSEPDFNAPITA